MDEVVNDNGFTDMRTMLKECVRELNEKVRLECLYGISSGFQPLDDIIGGFEKGRVYVIGGRPYMGKEELMLSMIRNIILERNRPVLFFSTNQMKSDYVQRLISIQCDISTWRLHHGALKTDEWERLYKRSSDLINALLYVHDSMDLPLNELFGYAWKYIGEKKIEMIFIDCLQMIDFAKEDNNTSEKLTKVMYSLKQLARQAGIPIVVGSMLSRDVEYREGIYGKQPQLTDLLDSSYIEELADVIIMVHRPEYYEIYQDDHGRDLHRRIEIFVKKNALKPLGSFFLEYAQETGVLSLMTSSNTTASKPFKLEELKTDNEAVKKLIDTFGLEENY